MPPHQSFSFILNPATRLGDESKKLIHAEGGKVLYAESPSEGQPETIYLEEIEMP